MKAFQFIADQELSGRLLVQMRWGQYALAAFGDHPAKPNATNTLQVAFDGRFRTCYPQSVVDLYFDFADGVDSVHRNRSSDSPPPDETAILYQSPSPDLVLIDRASLNARKVMATQNDHWVLLYQDSLCRLYGRREACDPKDAKNHVPLAARHVSALPQTEISPWPALPSRPRSEPAESPALVLNHQAIRDQVTQVVLP